MDYTEIAQQILEMDESELERTLVDLQPNPQLLADFYQVLSKSWNFRFSTLDIVGTGGDGRNSFNISTASSLLLASLGVPVAKFGNRAATSTSGSMDVLDYLGIKTSQNQEEAFEGLKKNNICFINAREVYPEFSKLANVRKKIGKPTIFNYLGPLLNPLKRAYTVLGVYNSDFEKLYLETFRLLGKDRFTIVNGNGYDEAIPFEKTRITKGSNGKSYSLVPTFSGSESDLEIKSPAESAEVIIGIFSGKDTSVRRECVLLNSAIAHSYFFNEDLKSSFLTVETALNSKKAINFLLRLGKV